MYVPRHKVKTLGDVKPIAKVKLLNEITMSQFDGGRSSDRA